MNDDDIEILDIFNKDKKPEVQETRMSRLARLEKMEAEPIVKKKVKIEKEDNIKKTKK